MMLSDKELLVLAAKAAGLDYRPNDGEIRYGDAAMKWNPLDNDGAALRLAVKLRIDVHTSDTFGIDGTGFTTADCCRLGKIISMQIPHSDDAYSATRRAIVRAAAAIGEGMK